MPSPSFLAMRQRNAICILQAVRKNPGLSRAQVAIDCTLAKSTVSSIVEDLLKTGVLLEQSWQVSSRAGRRPVGLTFNPEARVSIGISLDSDRIDTVISNLDGKLLKVRRKSLAPGQTRTLTEESLTAAVVAELEAILKARNLNAQRVAGLGLAAPGPISTSESTSIRGRQFNLATLSQSLCKKLDFQCRPLLDSNTNMAALAENRLGAAKHSEDALVVRLGTEIRSALLVNHRLLRGTKGLAGGIGHIVVPDNNIICSCGKTGCINSIAAADSIVSLCQNSGAAVDSIDDVIELALAGERNCCLVLEEAATAIGFGIASAINIVAPSSLIITGQLLNALDVVSVPLSTSLKKYCTGENLQNCNVIFSNSEKHSEAVGASLAPVLQEDFLVNLVRLEDSP